VTLSKLNIFPQWNPSDWRRKWKKCTTRTQYKLHWAPRPNRTGQLNVCFHYLFAAN